MLSISHNYHRAIAKTIVKPLESHCSYTDLSCLLQCLQRRSISSGLPCLGLGVYFEELAKFTEKVVSWDKKIKTSRQIFPFPKFSQVWISKKKVVWFSNINGLKLPHTIPHGGHLGDPSGRIVAHSFFAKKIRISSHDFRICSSVISGPFHFQKKECKTNPTKIIQVGPLVPWYPTQSCGTRRGLTPTSNCIQLLRFQPSVIRILGRKIDDSHFALRLSLTEDEKFMATFSRFLRSCHKALYFAFLWAALVFFCFAKIQICAANRSNLSIVSDVSKWLKQHAPSCQVLR